MILAPTLSRSPQTGDGAEIVAAAIRGGVLHPTGFPLQAWLDRVVAQAPGVPPALAIATPGLIAHAAAGGCIAETLRELGVAGSGRLLGAAAFLLFPPVWSLAVQPEVFSIAHAIIAATLLVAVRLARSGTEPGWPTNVSLGVLGGLEVAQHPIALTALPAWIASALLCLRVPERRVARGIVLFGCALIPAAVLFFSLPLLRTSSPWPDWGALRGPSDVLRHALRVEYGTFSLSAAEGATRSGLAVWFEDVTRWWSVALLLLPAGAIRVTTRREWRGIAFSVMGIGLAGLALLTRARLPEHSVSDAVLEHLQGPATIAGAVLIGLGFHEVRAALSTAAWRRTLAGAAAAATALWLLLGWPEADASRDRTLELYARGIAQELPKDALYVTEGDVETFLGVPTNQGVRYPISVPMTIYPWYAREVAPRLDPRLAAMGDSVADWSAVIARMRAMGLEVASTSPSLIAVPGSVSELRGLLYVSGPESDSGLTPGTVRAALALAPLAEELPTLPPRGHAFSRFYARRFAGAFEGAGEALRRAGEVTLANNANSIASELAGGNDRTLRRRLLRQFVTDCRRFGNE